MHHYRLAIWHNEVFLGHFQTDTPAAREAVRHIVQCLEQAGSMRWQLEQAQDEQRLLSTGPKGVRVISSEPVFCAIDSL
ncbi:cytoplasmic protein [Marinobacter xestospongiae]|uniref:cytoplasmic protein n=1 Tax=Marinobacter xestospongiae TaxID=994319 RepID=UPI002004521E|nr:cytoplasmic protein [Marinobacter xestospongiae]MCK7566021.1 cytoplasmic protein [Marinobacter xestospongiae]